MSFAAESGGSQQMKRQNIDTKTQINNEMKSYY